VLIDLSYANFIMLCIYAETLDTLCIHLNIYLVLDKKKNKQLNLQLFDEHVGLHFVLVLADITGQGW